MSQGQFDGLLDLLLLNVHSSDVGVGDIWLLSHLHHLNGGVGIGWQNVNDRLRGSVQSNPCIRLEILPVQGGQHSHIILRSLRTANNAIRLVNHFHEVTSAQVYGLNTFDLKNRVITQKK